MANGSFVTLKDLDQRIAIVRDNIRQLIEQAAAQSGAGDEDRNAARIAEQQAELDRLNKERDILQRDTLLKAPAPAEPKPPTKRKAPAKALKRKAAKKAAKKTPKKPQKKPAAAKKAKKKKK